jgi:serine/threonine protein kinase
MQSDIILNNKYIIHKKLGSGSFGKVYLGQNIDTKEMIAIKTEKISVSTSSKHDERLSPLTREFQVYKKLKKEYNIAVFETIGKYKSRKDKTMLDLINIPKIYDFYRDDKELVIHDNGKKYYEYTQYMVMELMGLNLEKVFNRNNRRFPYINICSIGYQMIKLIEYVHNIGWLHRDIKPENFVIGLKNQKKVYLLDFGLSRKWEDLVDKYNDFDATSNNSIVGTARYMSVNVHKGLPYSWRDDLESIGYVLIYFMKGELPWQGLHIENRKLQLDAIMNIKIKSSKELCNGLPIELKNYMEYCWNLKMEDPPNYTYLKKLFSNKIKMFKNYD